MSLAHPSQGSIVVNLNGIAPEVCQDFFHDSVEFACAEGSAFFNQSIDLALEGSFQQVSNEVMEVGIRQTVSQGKSFLARVIKLAFQIITEQELVKGRRCFHVVGGHVGVEISLVIVGEDELTRVANLVNQSIDITHTASPAHEDIRVNPIRISSIASRVLSSIGRKVDPAFFLVAGNFLTILLSEWLD